MLILVGVTVTVAINGGLFDKSKEAAKGTEIGREKEELTSAIATAYNVETGKVDKTKLKDALGTGWSLAEGDTAPYTVTSPKGNKFTVAENGKIDYKEKGDGKVPSTLSDLEKYIRGADGKGRILTGDNGIFNSNSFIDVPLTADVDETATLGAEFLTTGYNEDRTKGFIYAKCNNKAYKITCDVATYKSEKLEMIYEPKGKEGQKTTDEWTILYDNGSTAEAVSPTAMGELRLGYAEGTTDSDTQLSQAIESYNSAITTINNYCKNLEGLPTNSGVRSVGASKETTTAKYSSENLKTWNSAYNGVGLTGDTNFEQDLVRMTYWGVNSVGTDYWVASRVVAMRTTDRLEFNIRYIGENGDLDRESLWVVYIDGDTEGSFNQWIAVRPIITIENL